MVSYYFLFLTQTRAHMRRDGLTKYKHNYCVQVPPSGYKCTSNYAVPIREGVCKIFVYDVCVYKLIVRVRRRLWQRAACRC